MVHPGGIFEENRGGGGMVPSGHGSSPLFATEGLTGLRPVFSRRVRHCSRSIDHVAGAQSHAHFRSLRSEQFEGEQAARDGTQSGYPIAAGQVALRQVARRTTAHHGTRSQEQDRRQFRSANMKQRHIRRIVTSLASAAVVGAGTAAAQACFWASFPYLSSWRSKSPSHRHCRILVRSTIFLRTAGSRADRTRSNAAGGRCGTLRRRCLRVGQGAQQVRPAVACEPLACRSSHRS